MRRLCRTLFAAHGPEVQQAVVRYHQDNGGLPRHLKLRHSCEQIARRGRGRGRRPSWANGSPRSSMRACSPRRCCPAWTGPLRELSDRQVSAFVVSGTPAEEMRRVVAAKGLGPFFLEVHGSPRAKAEIIRDPRPSPLHPGALPVGATPWPTTGPPAPPACTSWALSWRARPRPFPRAQPARPRCGCPGPRRPPQVCLDFAAVCLIESHANAFFAGRKPEKRPIEPDLDRSSGGNCRKSRLMFPPQPLFSQPDPFLSPPGVRSMSRYAARPPKTWPGSGPRSRLSTTSPTSW